MTSVNWSVAKKLNIYGIIKQDTLSWTILLLDDQGGDYDVSGISKMVLTIKDAAGTAVLTFDSDDSDTTLQDGSLDGIKSVANLAAINLGILDYDLQITYTDATVKTWLYGKVLMSDTGSDSTTYTATVTVNTGADTVTLTVNNTYSSTAFGALGTLDPTAIDFLLDGFYTNYIQSGNVTFNLTGAPVDGKRQVVYFVSDGTNTISFNSTYFHVNGGLFGITNGGTLAAGLWKFFLQAENGKIDVNVPATTPADISGPTISSAVFAADNTYIDVTFDEGIYGANDGSTPAALADFGFTFAQNGGVATAWTPSSAKQNDNAVEGSASVLAGGETVIRIFGTSTGDADGNETLEIEPADGSSLYDVIGNAMADNETTGAVNLSALDVLNTPFPLVTRPLSTTSNYLAWTAVANATAYVVRNITLDTEIYNGANLKYINTSLIIDTSYDYEVIATANGFGDSIAATATQKTITYDPIIFWKGFGIGEGNIDNIFANKNDSVTYRIDRIKSILGTASIYGDGDTGKTLPSGGFVEERIDTAPYGMESPKPYFGGGASWRFLLQSTPSISGAFTYAFSVYIGATTQFEYWLGKTAGTYWIRKQNNANDVFFSGTGSGILSWTSALTANNRYKIVTQRNDSGQVRISNDGGATFSAWGLGSYTDTLDPDILPGYSTAGANDTYNDILLVEEVLTESQLSEFFNYEHFDAVIPESEPGGSTLDVEGVGWNTPSSGYIDDATLQYRATGLPQIKKQVITTKDKTIVLTHKSEADELEDSIYIFDHATGDVSDRIDLGVEQWTGTDIAHLHGNIEIFGGNLLHMEGDGHYDESGDVQTYFKYPDKNFDFSNINTKETWMGYNDGGEGKTAYPRGNMLGNVFYWVEQGWGGGSQSAAGMITIKYSDSDLRSWKKFQIANEDTTTDWLYPYLVSNPNDDKLRLFLNNLNTSPATDHYDYTFYLESTDGYTWTNKTGSYSHDIRMNQDGPLTLGELITNYIALDESASATTYGYSCVNAHIDENGELYGIFSNGEGGAKFGYATDGNAFTFVDVDMSDKTAYIFRSSGYGEQEGGYVIKTGNNNYSLFAAEYNGGKDKVIEYRTTNKFTACAYYQDITSEDTKKHSNINGTEDPNHVVKALLVCTRQVDGQTGSVGADKGEAINFYELTGATA